MRFTQIILAALSAAASQAVIITNSDFSNIAVGTPFVITYSDAMGQVTVYLGTGTPANVVQGALIGTSSGATGSIPWTPTSGGSFALKIYAAGAPSSLTNPNFSGFFNVTGPVVSTTTTAPLTTSSSMTSASSTTMMTMPLTNGTTTATTMTSTMTNGTMTSSTGSSTRMGSSTSSTGMPTQIPNSMAAGLASPIAFVFLAVGALLTMN